MRPSKIGMAAVSVAAVGALALGGAVVLLGTRALPTAPGSARPVDLASVTLHATTTPPHRSIRFTAATAREMSRRILVSVILSEERRKPNEVEGPILPLPPSSYIESTHSRSSFPEG